MYALIAHLARWLYLHELEGGLEVLHGVHLDTEELDAHDEADGALDHIGTLLLLTQLLQLSYELLTHRREPDPARGGEERERGEKRGDREQSGEEGKIERARDER